MNRRSILSIIVLILSLLFLFSCDKELENVQVTPSFIKVAQTGGSYELDVRANCAWSSSIMYKDDISGYISLNKTSGNGNETIQLTIAQNSATSRNCIIEFYTQEANTPQSSVSIIQEGVQ